MQCISEKEAITKWLEDGFDDVFEFEDYVKFLERTHIFVIRESMVTKEGEK
jgi:hypothetical protein